MISYLVIESVCIATAFYWFWLSCKSSLELKQIRSLPRMPTPDATSSSLPSVTVVVPIRDGANQIKSTVDSFRRQSGIDLDLVLVNDRSSDGTGTLIEEVSEREDWITAKHVSTLPNGWLGKCHAIEVGLTNARGDWILFADGDVELSHDTIARSIQLAELEKAHHVTSIFRPREATNLAEACYNNLIALAHTGEFAGVNRDRPGSFGGVGAFNLVRRDALKQIGSYKPLRLSVCDDAMLAKRLRSLGFRSRVFTGNEVTAAWGRTVRDHIRLFEKNMFAFASFRLVYAVAAALILILAPWMLAIMATACFFAGSSKFGIVSGIALASTMIPAFVLCRASSNRLTSVMWTPLMWPVIAIAMLNSTWKTTLNGGILWRDTFYPLPLLREFNSDANRKLA